MNEELISVVRLTAHSEALTNLEKATKHLAQALKIAKELGINDRHLHIGRLMAMVSVEKMITDAIARSPTTTATSIIEVIGLVEMRVKVTEMIVNEIDTVNLGAKNEG